MNAIGVRFPELPITNRAVLNRLKACRKFLIRLTAILFLN